MKKFKYLFGLTLLMSLVLIPATSQAVSMQDLLNQIAKLTAELNFYRRGSITPVVPACTFVHDLSLGDGEEGDGLSIQISNLQKILIKGGYLNIKNPTGYFGKMTMVAIKVWQKVNNLPPTGSIGSSERSVLCGSITPVEPPVVGKAPWISTISYISGKNVVTITGERLEAAKFYFNGSLISKENITWTNTGLNFIPTTYQNGIYAVYAKNTYGKSDTVYVTMGDGINQPPQITYIGSPDNGLVLLKGISLKTVTAIYIGSNSVEWTGGDAGTSDIKIILPYNPPISAGTYPVYVKNVFGSSNTVNVIIPTIPNKFFVTVLYPNGGEVLDWGQTAYITWNSNDYSGSFDVSIRGINSGNFYSVKLGAAGQAADKMSVTWIPTLGSYEKDTQFKARVCITGTTICGESPNSFSIKF